MKVKKQCFPLSYQILSESQWDTIQECIFFSVFFTVASKSWEISVDAAEIKSTAHKDKKWRSAASCTVLATPLSRICMNLQMMKESALWKINKREEKHFIFALKKHVFHNFLKYSWSFWEFA